MSLLSSITNILAINTNLSATIIACFIDKKLLA